MSWVNSYIDSYHDFIKDNTVIKDLPSGWTLIAPPVFGIFNDGLEIYIKKENNNIRFSDDSITLQNLSLLGISIKSIATQIDYVLLKYGLQKVKDEICLEVSEKNFARGKHNFLAGLIELNDLQSHVKHRFHTGFKQEVINYLEHEKINYTRGFIIRSNSALEFTYDFQVAHRTEELVIQAFSRLNMSNVPAFLYGWENVQDRKKLTGKDLVGIALINDSEKEFSQELASEIKTKKVLLYTWSEKDKFKDRLLVAS